mmetsp:Transcript_38394/g.62224  ORF Transcript_38394/g.62224 Transcript_38394/m.62224 type:complete len:514 (-) Transcript_38394:220-1761(-)
MSISTFFRHKRPRLCEPEPTIYALKDLPHNTCASAIGVVYLIDNALCEKDTRNGKVMFASLILADQTLRCFKVCLWRENSKQVESLSVGDIVLVKKFKTQVYRDKLQGNSISGTQIHRLNQENHLPYCTTKQLESLITWRDQHLTGLMLARKIKEQRAKTESHTIGKKTNRNVVVEYVKCPCLQKDSTVHMKGRVLVGADAQRSAALAQSDESRAKKKRRVAVSLSDESHSVRLFLWNDQVKLVDVFRKSPQAVFDIRFLSVQDDRTTPDVLVLHSTARTTATAMSGESSCDKKESSSLDSSHSSSKTISVSAVKRVRGQEHVQLVATLGRVRCVSCVGGSSLTVDLRKLKSNVDYSSLLESMLYLCCRTCFTETSRDAHGIHFCRSCMLPSSTEAFMWQIRPMQVTLYDSTGHLNAELKNCAKDLILPSLDLDGLAQELFCSTAASKTHTDAALKALELLAHCLSQRELRPIVKANLCCQCFVDDNEYVIRQTFEVEHIEMVTEVGSTSSAG